ncbi:MULTISPECIES: hypothetical protein [unclassified Sphingobium]|uniref:hypothetical protein n=1 Tax=unclassified Sphingobium TaxID=2611147 RepID=UPI0035A6FDAF
MKMAGPFSDSLKVRENRLREAAKRQRAFLKKSRTRDPRAIDYGGYMLVEGDSNSVLVGAEPYPFSADLDEIETWLNRSVVGQIEFD